MLKNNTYVISGRREWWQRYWTQPHAGRRIPIHPPIGMELNICWLEEPEVILPATWAELRFLKPLDYGH